MLLATATLAEPIMSWDFNTPGDLEGWTQQNSLANTTVADGVLTTTVVDWDPSIAHTVFERPLAATPTQVIELRMTSPVAGRGEFYWTNTTESPYGGFSPGKETLFDVKPGWQVYHVRPFWQGEKQIIKLRLDLPDIKKGEQADQTYHIDTIRILDPGSAPPVPANWDFGAGAASWGVDGAGSLRAENGALVADLQPGDKLVAPPVAVDPLQDAVVSFVMSVTTGKSGRITWATDGANGTAYRDFPVIPDRRPHVYNIPVADDGRWSGKVIYLALEPAAGSACHVRLDWLRISPQPAGDAEIEVKRFLLSEALPRAGQPCEVAAEIANRGGEIARSLRAELVLPSGLSLAPGDVAVKTIRDLEFYEPRDLTWRVIGSKPGPVRLRLRVSGDGSAEARATDRLLPNLSLPRADYVPEPKPVRGPYDVGVYYFPGWAEWRNWQPISDFPERRPVLGWYREGSPEVADWQIKWAVEHGITFFCYDWYWTQGGQSLTHGLHEGYLKARYRHLLKFCLLWANHSPTKHTPEDNVKVCQYWIDSYFKQPEYHKLNGRPLLVMFSPYAMQRDLGIGGTREAIELWHKMTREAGVGEILVAGCGRAEELDGMNQMGFDAITGYNWPSCGVQGRNYVPYVEVARKQFDIWWMPMARKKAMPVIVPTSPGWDNRPWAGDSALVQLDRTPRAFEEHLRLAKQFIDETGQPKVTLIEAWNEFGEGSYCEPHKEFGFGHLDAIRKVFCPDAGQHEDYGPKDVDLGPYDVGIPETGKTAWEFNTDGDSEGWGPMMGLEGFKVAGRAMQARAIYNDPAFAAGVRLPSAKFRTIEIAMAVTGLREADMAQLFWQSTLQGESEAASVRVPLAADGKMHVYRFEVGKNSLWRGLVQSLRLDPCSTDGATVKVDYIRALP